MEKQGLERKVELWLGNWLKIGVYTSVVLATIGGILCIQQPNDLNPHFKHFESTPLLSMSDLMMGLLHFRGVAVIQLAVLVLISTPILRVVFSLFGFILEKDRLYVVITLIVLAVIMFGMVSGLGG